MLVMKRFLILLFLSILILPFANCTQKIVFERKQYNSSYPSKLTSDYNSANIKMEVVEAKNSDSINKIIFENIKEISSFIDNKKVTINNYNDIAKSFIASYKDVKNQVPNDKLRSWEYHIESNIEYETEDFVNIVINYYTSYGELEGFAEKRSLIFDKISGNQLKKADVFVNIPRLTQLVEMKFRSKYKILTYKSYNDQGFCMENNRFKLADNFIYNIDGITFFYNLNEIAPYERGHFEVFMSYDELDKYLQVK